MAICEIIQNVFFGKMYARLMQNRNKKKTLTLRVKKIGL